MSTSRLKRKLGDLGVDTSSRRANESFCLIGTPLPPLEKSKDTGEFVPLWKQEVRDEKGRRRLHGAFTGGFSAGYFNSVGSKEGWAPATFVSSRSDRAKKKEARPEDFMDEEDLQELRESRNLIDTTEEMDFLGGTKNDVRQQGSSGDPEQDSIAKALESSLLPAPQDSVGARILKKMGWRLGQGVGPRVSLRQRKLQDLQALQPTSGSRVTHADIKITEEDLEDDKHTYAPRDTPVLRVERKDNSHGLGYRPGLGLQESVGQKASGLGNGRNLAAGFGLGALNDVDEDDLDVYDGINDGRNRQAYDITDHAEDETITVGSRSERSRKQPDIRSAPSDHFRDGTSVLAGFMLSNKPVIEEKFFPLPEIPKGWKPNPKRVWDSDPNKENLQKPPTSSEVVPHGQWKSRISADERGTLLGETPLPSAPRSVFDYMSAKDRERLKNIAAGPSPGAPGTRPTAALAPATITIPRLDPQIAQAALRGFQPFPADPVRQARYTLYLQSQAGAHGSVSPPKPNPGQSVEDYNKELEDYSKGAQIFKPMTGAMAGRFTSAAVLDLGPQIHEGLHQPTAEEMKEKEEQQRKEEEEKVTPKVHAARMGMFGPMTRESKPWQPARLLCKRFGVKDPNPPPEMPADDPVPAATASTSQQPVMPTSQPGTDTLPTQMSSGPRDLANIGLGEDETQGRDTLTYQRPAMDVFKAIFASDSEDSDNEKDDDHDEPPVFEPPASSVKDDMKKPDAFVINASLTADNTPVDLATFKPTFIPREGKSKKPKRDKDWEKSTEKNAKKKEKKKEKKSVLISFEVDEDGGDEAMPKPSKERPKKKRKEKEKKQDDDDEGMWVEKSAPETVRNLIVPQSEPLPQDEAVSATGKGRKRAVDFM
ncbi:hypothetical protein BDQ12DRAFT_681110 [Crucibulum laeve]|uniref:G-patch domain-containing protein n=1 Tax=Crucibulum laeve TaxID=68775 RepID=A0A5C3M3F4_9AGAR|nr:hypothetical protein BDQ12DRAFT_681110 [Crucibulum laeve]